MLARPKYNEPPATTRTMRFIFLDGQATPLKVIRQKAREDHMSPTTMNFSLKSLEHSGQVDRTVDSSTRPPSVYYKRTASSTSQRGKTFADWFDQRLVVIRGIILAALREIAENPQTPIDKLHIMASKEIDGQPAPSAFELLATRWPWNIVTDFQDMVRSGRVKDLEKTKTQIESMIERELPTKRTATSRHQH
jgi:hypothetical protein